MGWYIRRAGYWGRGVSPVGQRKLEAAEEAVLGYIFDDDIPE